MHYWSKINDDDDDDDDDDDQAITRHGNVFRIVTVSKDGQN